MSKYKAILVGCGGMSNAWIKASAHIDDLVLVALVDLNLDSALKRAEENSIDSSHCYTDLNEAMDHHESEIVFDCTVPAARDSVVSAALLAKKHVLSEKPMSDSMASAEKLAKLAAKQDRIFAVIQNRRYAPNIRKVQSALSNGIIGDIHTVNADFYVGAHFEGFRAEMDHVLLLDMAIHSFDQARFISGESPLSVFCQEYNPPNSWYKGSASAQAIFQMTNNLIFNYRGSWCAEGLNTLWECDWRIIGTKGTFTWNGGDRMKVELTNSSDEKSLVREGIPTEIPEFPWKENMRGHEGLLREFVQSLKSGSKPMTHCDDNIESLRMVFGAIESSKEKKLITFN